MELAPDIRVFISTLSGGGAERVCLILCNGWVEMGLRVQLIMARGGGVFLDQLDRQVDVVDLKAGRNRKSFFRVIRALRPHSETPVLVFGLDLAILLIMAKLLGQVRSPLIYREGSHPRDNTLPVFRPVYKVLIPRFDHVIAQSSFARAELMSLGVPGDRIVVIPNPAHCAGNGTGHRMGQSSKADRGGRQGMVFIAVGRLSREKGFDRLVRSFLPVIQEYPDATLTILGEGPDRESLTRLVTSLGLEGKVFLPGFTANLSEWYGRATAYILSSHYEGMPNALVEAILHDCPVICARTRGGVEELLGICGLQGALVGENNFEQELVTKIKELVRTDVVDWVQVREKLERHIAPQKVVREYAMACASSRCPPGAGLHESSRGASS